MVTKMYENIWITHAPNSEIGIHGLGQVAKEPMLNDGDYFDFLSKDCYYDGEYKVVRKIDRVVNKHCATLNAGKVSNEHLFAAEVNRCNAI